MDNNQAILEQGVDEGRLNAIDDMIENWDLDKLKDFVKQQCEALREGLSTYENVKWNSVDASIKSLPIIRQELRKAKIELAQLGLDGYYAIEKIKEKLFAKNFTYTLGTTSTSRGKVTLERVSNISTRQFFTYLRQEFSRSSVATGAEAILTGRVTLTKIAASSQVTENQTILFQRMWTYGRARGVNKGIIFEAFEHAVADGKDKVQNVYKIRESTFQAYITKASGNVPFFTYHGDVKGAQVKFGGFTLARISTIYQVLQWLYVFLLTLDNEGNLTKASKKIKNTIFKGADMQSITAKMDKIILQLAETAIGEAIKEVIP